MMLPNAQELEDAVLGAVLLEPHAIRTVSLILSPEMFYREQNKRVFNACFTLFKSGSPIDILTVTEQLKRTKELELVGGSFYVANLTSRIASAANIEFHARIVEQKFINRELILLGNEISKDSFLPDADCFKTIEKIYTRVRDVTSFMKTKTTHVSEVFAEIVSDIKKVSEDGKALGIPSGYENVDVVTGGWQKGDLNIIAARPGMGKTALALALAKNPAMQHNIPVGIFSLEMTAKRLVGRLASSESEISSTKISQKSLSHAELMRMTGRCFKLNESPIYIDDTPGLKFSQLRALAKKLVWDFKVEMIIIDYLQLMHGDERGNREQEISYISRNLKVLAKELNIPIIALSQLSRKVEDREDRRPLLSDLRESGAIEQDADNVIFLFRPAYYDLFPNGYPYSGRTLASGNLLIVDFAKGRELETKEVPLLFYGSTMTINNYNYKENEI